MTHARKLVLLKLADLIDDRQGFTAYPAFTTMAKYANVSRDTAIRAVNIGKQIGLLIRVKGAGKKGLGGTSNRYGFRLKEVADVLLLSDAKEVAGEPLKRSQASIERSSRPATQQAEDKRKDNSAEDSRPYSVDSLIAKEFGECGPEAPKNEPGYLDIKRAILASWASFPATTVIRHMERYGPAKTLEVVECSARLGYPDIRSVLDAPLMEWSAPTVTEIPYTPTLRALYADALLAA